VSGVQRRSSAKIRVNGLKAGDPEAWEALVAELGATIAGYVFRLGAPDPDEVVSATFESVARSIGSFEGSASQLRSFVFRIAHDRAVDAIRRAQRQPLVVSDDIITDQPASDDMPVAFEDPDVLASLAELSDDQRRMIELRYVIGLSTRETALAMGRSEVATRVALSRAKAKLRGLLDGMERGGS
jgi:RNA polymerase sigma-70 factor (ECF subfamily)